MLRFLKLIEAICSIRMQATSKTTGFVLPHDIFSECQSVQNSTHVSGHRCLRWDHSANSQIVMSFWWSQLDGARLHIFFQGLCIKSATHFMFLQSTVTTVKTSISFQYEILLQQDTSSGWISACILAIYIYIMCIYIYIITICDPQKTAENFWIFIPHVFQIHQQLNPQFT